MVEKKLDALLINPNSRAKVYQSLGSELAAVEPPVWSGLIATFLRDRGWSVKILDAEAESLALEETVDKVRLMRPKLVSVIVYGQQPSASTQNMVGIMEIMDLLKDSNIIRMYTGPHPSSLPRKTLEDDPNSFVCQGEGPYTLYNFLKVFFFPRQKQVDKEVYG